MRSRVVLVVVLGFFWVGAVAARLYQLQVLRYDHYEAKARRQQQLVVELDPPRGTIYDARGRELAVSVQVESAWADPSDIADPKATAAALAPVLGVDAAGLARRLAKRSDFVWVARKLDPPLADRVRRLDLKGIRFLPESKRYYPMGELAAQVLGYVGTDNKGLAGIEQQYEAEVAGRPGRRTLLRDARRGTVVAPGLAYADPQPGSDLYLTLDTTIQHIAERELAVAVEERHARSGSAVLLDPATGAVLAMATYPSFDPNSYGDFTPARWRNRVIADAYEPGSTFKVITAASALDAGLVRPEEEFDCGMGSITLLGHRIRDHVPYGRLTFAQVIAKSSNVGVIKTALRLGDQRLYATIHGFGFGRPTGIDLPGESQGIVAPLSVWRPLTKADVAFGQGISVTPLQLAAALGAVADGGALRTPYVVAAVGRDGRIERRHRGPRAGVVAQPISPATARQLTALLEGVVTDGTGKSAAIAGYRVAGKTGTAQKPGIGGYAGNGYVPSFVGFAPADRPALVAVVAVDEPQGFAYYGAQVAAPVFSTVLRQVLLYLDVRPERPALADWPGQRSASKPTTMVASLAPTLPGQAAADDGEELAPHDVLTAPDPTAAAVPAVSRASTAATPPASPTAVGSGGPTDAHR